MPGFLLHTAAVVNCTHGILAQIPPAQTRVLVGGLPVATLATKMTVMGCPFTIPGPKPQPCVSIQWLVPAVRVTVMGQPALVQQAPGPGAALCLSAEKIPNGPPIVGWMQARVIAT